MLVFYRRAALGMQYRVQLVASVDKAAQRRARAAGVGRLQRVLFVTVNRQHSQAESRDAEHDGGARRRQMNARHDFILGRCARVYTHWSAKYAVRKRRRFQGQLDSRKASKHERRMVFRFSHGRGGLSGFFRFATESN